MAAPRVKSFSVETFRAGLKRPFITSLGRKTETINVGISLRLEDGSRGYGEASSSLALAHLTPARLSSALRSLGRWALGRELSCPGALISEAWERCGNASPAAAAFESALLEASLASKGLRLADWFGGKLERTSSDITLSAWDPETTFAAAREAAREGFAAFKIKVSGEFSADMARIRSARRARPGVRLILDGNQALSPAGALRLAEACLKEKMPVDLLEQPLPKSDLRKMAALARSCPVPLAADESAATPEDAARIAEMGAARVINIKAAKSGLLRSLEIAAVARAAGLDLMIGCMAETARGLKASVHMALGTGFFRYVDLDSDHLLAAPRGDCGWERRGPVLSLR